VLRFPLKRYLLNEKYLAPFVKPGLWYYKAPGLRLFSRHKKWLAKTLSLAAIYNLYNGMFYPLCQLAGFFPSTKANSQTSEMGWKQRWQSSQANLCFEPVSGYTAKVNFSAIYLGFRP